MDEGKEGEEEQLFSDGEDKREEAEMKEDDTSPDKSSEGQVRLLVLDHCFVLLAH